MLEYIIYTGRKNNRIMEGNFNLETIYIGSDHAGFGLKNFCKKLLVLKSLNVVDLGNHDYDPGDDYPDYALMVAKKTAETGSMGIIICDSGVGVCIAANKVNGIRAVNAQSTKIAIMSRKHNNTNILCLGQNYISRRKAKKIILSWLNTGFSSQERHQRRVKKLDSI